MMKALRVSMTAAIRPVREPAVPARERCTVVDDL